MITIAVLGRRSVLEYSDKLSEITGVLIRAGQKRRRSFQKWTMERDPSKIGVLDNFMST